MTLPIQNWRISTVLCLLVAWSVDGGEGQTFRQVLHRHVNMFASLQYARRQHATSCRLEGCLLASQMLAKVQLPTGSKKVSCQLLAIRAIVVAMIIGFANTKGGVGKTTLAVHLAVWLFDRGHRVALVDIDDQRLSSRWIARVESEITVVSAKTPKQVQKQLRQLAKTHDYVIADGPAGQADVSIALLLCADLVVLPVTPSPLDLWSVVSLATDLVKQVQKSNRGKPDVRLVINIVDRRTNVSRQVKEAVGTLHIPAARTQVRCLASFVTAVKHLTVVTRMKGHLRAKHDVNRLFEELVKIGLPKRRSASEPQQKRRSTGRLAVHG